VVGVLTNPRPCPLFGVLAQRHQQHFYHLFLEPRNRSHLASEFIDKPRAVLYLCYCMRPRLQFFFIAHCWFYLPPKKQQIINIGQKFFDGSFSFFN